MMKKSKNDKNGRDHRQQVPAELPKKALSRSRCIISGKCGACSMIDVSYEEQLRKKQELVEKCLGEFAAPLPIIRMKNPDHYRNKANAAYGRDYKGKMVCGIFKQGSHEVVLKKQCLVENTHADRILQSVYRLVVDFRIPVYDEDRGTGLLRYVQIRTAHVTHQVMVTLVCASPVFPSVNNFIKELLKVHPEITTIVLNINDRRTSIVMGKREKVLYGPGTIEDELCGKKFRISSRSFYQVNSIQTEKLYNIAIDAAGLSGKERIIDAYCGIGTIGIIASDKCREVISTESNKDAVEDAVVNASLNRIKNIRFYEEDAGAFMQQMAAAGERADVLFMDPPRAGADEAFLQSTLTLAPEKIVYISCNPLTLKENLKVLTTGGYEVRKIVPVDMFPYTMHVETVVLLSGEKVDGHIDIDLDVERLER